MCPGRCGRPSSGMITELVDHLEEKQNVDLRLRDVDVLAVGTSQARDAVRDAALLGTAALGPLARLPRAVPDALQTGRGVRYASVRRIDDHRGAPVRQAALPPDHAACPDALGRSLRCVDLGDLRLGQQLPVRPAVRRARAASRCRGSRCRSGPACPMTCAGSPPGPIPSPGSTRSPCVDTSAARRRNVTQPPARVGFVHRDVLVRQRAARAPLRSNGAASRRDCAAAPSILSPIAAAAAQRGFPRLLPGARKDPLGYMARISTRGEAV